MTNYFLKFRIVLNHALVKKRLAYPNDKYKTPSIIIIDIEVAYKNRYNTVKISRSIGLRFLKRKYRNWLKYIVLKFSKSQRQSFDTVQRLLASAIESN